MGLLKLGQGLALKILENIDIDIADLVGILEDGMKPGPKESSPSSDIPYTPRSKKVLALADKEAKAMNSYTGTEHILLGLIKENDGVAASILKKFGVDYQEIKEQITNELNPEKPQSTPTKHEPVTAGEPRRESSKKKNSILKNYGKDLTELAEQNKLDPVVGRETEVDRVIQILCRRTKNNPVLIGEAGVGKTAIAEGLAQHIVNKNVPDRLLQKRVMTLDLASLVAGTTYRGQFEERIKSIMNEIKKDGNIILFIDELHTLVGAGSASGSMDASNIFKPALSRGELQIIGATTLSEYRMFIEKDTALERRFQQVKVDPATVDQTIEILRGIRPKYEQHHKAKFLDDSLVAAAKLSERYISNRFLPDKAIDLLDEAGSRARMDARIPAPDLKTFENQIAAVAEEKREAISSQQFEKAASLRDKEQKIQAAWKEATAQWNKDKEEKEVIVGEEQIMKVLSKWTGIPLTKMSQSEAAKLLALEKDLEEKVIGQTEAVVAVSKAMRRARANLKDPNRPIGSFLFLGPTGVGKTFLTQTLAEHMFGTKDSVVQIDMSEYMEKFSVSRLIGAPPGYVGYEEGGQLTERVRRKPYCVVLFDEVEKAHPDALHLLLQIMEEGCITDSLGRKVDFKNTIVIMTSNVGAPSSAKKQVSLGFGAKDESEDHTALKQKTITEAKQYFKPELLNRLDGLIVFKSLEKPELIRIAELEINKISSRLKDQGIILTLDDSAKAFIADKGYDPAYGARPMRRAVEQYIEDPMSEDILKGSFKEGNSVIATKDDDKLKFELVVEKKTKTKKN